VSKKYKASTRPPATLPLSPRVLKCIFLIRRSTHNSPCPASLWPFLESAVMAIMVFVSQHEEVSMRAPRFRVAYQAPHTRSPETEAMRSQETDPMRSPQTGASTRAPRPPPVELDAEGQSLGERLRAFRTQAVRKNYKVSTRPPTTLPLSPRV
jgi:hypothetical protein